MIYTPEINKIFYGNYTSIKQNKNTHIRVECKAQKEREKSGSNEIRQHTVSKT